MPSWPASTGRGCRKVQRGDRPSRRLELGAGLGEGGAGWVEVVVTGAGDSRWLELAPAWAGVLVVADVHGHAERFAAFARYARTQHLFLVQLGDLIDRGPDSPGALRLARQLREDGCGEMLAGNHELKLHRLLTGRTRALAAEHRETLRQLAAAADGYELEVWFRQTFPRLPLVLGRGATVLVHGALTPAMLPPVSRLDRRQRTLALFGEVVGRRRDGLPIRGYGWLDRLPAGLLVIAGHDPLSGTCLYLRTGRGGARLLHLDAGAGQGGPLAAAVLDREGRLRTTLQIPPDHTEPRPCPVVPWPDDSLSGADGPAPPAPAARDADPG